MKLKNSTKLVTEIFEHDCGDGITFHETRVNDEITEQYFTNKYKRNKSKEFRYYYYPNLSSFMDNNDYVAFCPNQDFYDFALDNPTIDIENFTDWQDVYCFNVSIDGFIYHIWKEEPISIPIYCDYIGGYTNKDYDLKKCMEHLSRNPNVSELEIEEIPYYNSDFHGHSGLQFFYYPPQEEIDMLYHKYKKDQYWSCKIRDEYKTSYENPSNLLNLKQFKLKEPVKGKDY